MTAGASRAAPTIAQQPALAPPPQPPPAPTARALPPGLVEQGGQNWTPIRGQICKPIDILVVLPCGASIMGPSMLQHLPTGYLGLDKIIGWALGSPLALWLIVIGPAIWLICWIFIL